MPYLDKEKQREANKKWYQLNKEKKAEYNRKWNEENKEKRSEYNKKWKEENKGYYRGYTEKRKEKKAEYDRKYNEEHKEHRSEQRNEKRAYCLEYLGGKCVKSGDTERLEFDHIKREGKKYSIASKLTCTFDNLKEELNKCQLLCVDCHLEKTASEWTK